MREVSETQPHTESEVNNLENVDFGLITFSMHALAATFHSLATALLVGGVVWVAAGTSRCAEVSTGEYTRCTMVL